MEQVKLTLDMELYEIYMNWKGATKYEIFWECCEQVLHNASIIKDIVKIKIKTNLVVKGLIN